LRINKTFIKESRTKKKSNQKNKELGLKYQKQGPSNTFFFWEGVGAPTNDKQPFLIQHAPHQKKENVVMLLMTL
jgi:hypothetical protein